MATPKLPTRMKAILITYTGPPSVLEHKINLPLPIPNKDEVLIKNTYIGLNYIDINFRSGLYPTPLPYIPGIEAEGIIISSSTPSFKAGDRVVWIRNGAYAEYSTCNISKVFALPEGIEHGVAAASIAQEITALSFIERTYPVQKKDWILIQGASGGVGLWLCQLLSKVVGARVIGTAGMKEKCELVKANGADVVVEYKREDVVGRVREVTGGEGVRAVFDCVGKVKFEGGLECLGREGWMVVVGNASGNVPPFDITKLSAKNLRVMKPSVFGYIGTRQEFTTYSKQLFEFIGENGVEGIPRKVFKLEDIREAHVELGERRTAGKLLLKV